MTGPLPGAAAHREEIWGVHSSSGRRRMHRVGPRRSTVCGELTPGGRCPPPIDAWMCPHAPSSDTGPRRAPGTPPGPPPWAAARSVAPRSSTASPGTRNSWWPSADGPRAHVWSAHDRTVPSRDASLAGCRVRSATGPDCGTNGAQGGRAIPARNRRVMQRTTHARPGSALRRRKARAQARLAA